jgi:hypothetical protein
MNRYETMSINDPIFVDLRKDFDITLQRLFEKMKQAEEDTGTLTVKVKVSLLRDSVANGKNEAKVFHRPHFEVTTTSSVAQKESTKSTVDMHGYELIKDSAVGYLLQNISNQMTLEDYQEDEN